MERPCRRRIYCEKIFHNLMRDKNTINGVRRKENRDIYQTGKVSHFSLKQLTRCFLCQFSAAYDSHLSDNCLNNEKAHTQTT